MKGYIQLEITGTYEDGEYNISMSTLRYVLKGKYKICY